AATASRAPSRAWPASSRRSASTTSRASLRPEPPPQPSEQRIGLNPRRSGPGRFPAFERLREARAAEADAQVPVVEVEERRGNEERAALDAGALGVLLRGTVAKANERHGAGHRPQPLEAARVARGEGREEARVLLDARAVPAQDRVRRAER